MYSQLAGSTVVLTREPEDNVPLAAQLRAAHADVFECPCVRTEPLADTNALAAALAALAPDDWLVVTSRHGADAIARCGATRAAIAAVGGATAERLRARGLGVDFEPSVANGEHLARELPDRGGLVLIARSDRALPDLPTILRERGLSVREVVAYHTFIGPRGDVAGLRTLLAGDRPVAVMFHSPSAVAGLLEAVDPMLLARASILVAGRSTLRAVRDRLGLGARVSLMEEEAAHVAHR